MYGEKSSGSQGQLVVTEGVSREGINSWDIIKYK